MSTTKLPARPPRPTAEEQLARRWGMARREALHREEESRTAWAAEQRIYRELVELRARNKTTIITEP